MNDKQKIELGEYIIGLVLTNSERGNFLKDVVPGYKMIISNSVFNKIVELENKPDSYSGGLHVSKDNTTHHSESFNNLPDPFDGKLLCTCHNLFGPETDDKGYICGVCYFLKCNECIDNDFERCPICEHDGKKKNYLRGKDGTKFRAGDTLRNEKSLTTSIKILQVNETHVVYSGCRDPFIGGGCVEIQDFIDAGWIVHERVTKYGNGESCKFFQSVPIGGAACQTCSYNKNTNTDQNWIICNLYNKENENERK